MLKIRFCQIGRLNRRSYRLVVTDARSPRDGKYIQAIGSYDPHKEKGNVKIEEEDLHYWLRRGAVPTEKAKASILSLFPHIAPLFQKKKKAKKRRSQDLKAE